MTTKDRILNAALVLFNEQGTAAVSTNHIAEAAGISPGNLYYHYRNKEAIIRALFERLFALWDETLVLPPDHMPGLADVTALVHANFRIMADYRFLYGELTALLRQDVLLRERYGAVRLRGYDGFREIFTALAAAGTLEATLDAAAIDRLADVCWMITEFWLPTVELKGETVDDEHMLRGTDLMMQVLTPYIRT